MDNYILSIPLLFGILFGYTHHFNHLYVSNTKMIIRQSDQIQFLLTRIMELETKIKKLQLDIDIPNEDFLDTIVEDAEDVEDIVVKDVEDIVAEDIVAEEKDDKEFELVEPTSTFKINKNKGWLQYIF